MPQRLTFGVLLLVAVAAVLWLWRRGDLPPATTPPDSIAEAAASATSSASGEASGETKTSASNTSDAGLQRTEVTQPRRDDAPIFTVTGLVLSDRRSPDLGSMRVLAYQGSATDSPGFLIGGQNEPGASPAFLLRGEPIASASVDQAGNFLLRAPQAHLRLSIEHDLYLLPMPELVHVPADSRATEVVLAPLLGSCLRGKLFGERAAAVTSVRLIVEPDPMSAMRDMRAFLGAMMSMDRTRAAPDAEGVFVMRGVPADAPLVLTAEGDRVFAAMPLAPLAPGESREVAVAVRNAAGLRVLVTDEAGGPIAEASVTVNATDVSGSMSAQLRAHRGATDATGMCSIRSLEPTRVRIEATATGYTSAETTLDLTADAETQRVQLKLSEGGIVTGIVTTPEGKPLPDARVAHHPSASIPLLGDMAAQLGPLHLAQVAQSGTRTDAEGRFRLTGLADEGEFLVIAAHPDFGANYAKGVHMGDTDVAIAVTPLAVVRGRVVADEDEQPIVSYTVKVRRTMFLVMHSTVSQQVVHAADGAFQLTGIPPGSYTLQVEADGRSPANRDLSLADGDVDLGTISLPRGATIAGVVQDENGSPVRGALVRRRQGALADNPMLAMLSGESANVRTDAEGRFRLGPLPPARIQLLASADGFASGRSERIQVEAGQSVEGVVISLGHGGTIRGRLSVGPGDRPDTFMLMVQEQQTQVSAGAELAADGTFTITDLDPGQYVVQAMPNSLLQSFGNQNWKPGQGMNFGDMFQKLTDSVVSQRCTVRAGETTEVTLDASDLVTGTRWTLRVEVGGKAMENGLIEATAVDGGRMRAAMFAGGTATLGNVEPGAYRLQVRSGMTLAPVGAPQTAEFPQGKSEHRTTLSLPSGELRGRVVDASTGKPLQTALVRLIDEASTERDDAIGMALTDAAGQFVFPGLAEGSYGVVAADHLSAREGTASQMGIRVAPGITGEPIELRAQPAATVSVLVTNSGGAPIVGATLLCVDRDGRPMGALALATSDSSGRAWFGGLPRGDVRVVGRAPGMAPGASEVRSIDPAQPTEFLLQLDSGARTTVHAVDQQGQPLSGATLTARCNDGPWLPAMLVVESSHNGTYQLGRLTRGTWQFRVSHPRVGTLVGERTIGNEPAVSVVVAPQ